MNKIDKWLFPFLGRDGKEISDVQIYYSALSANDNGFYPLGANGLWHGGIHFGEGSGGLLKQEAGIRCIADGEVVAYRLNTAYPLTLYPQDIDPITKQPKGPPVPVSFSSGFVLVRHKLVLPPEPPAAGSTPPATPPETPTADILTFYSLYMHLQNWTEYETNLGLPRPNHWGRRSSVYFKVGSRATESDNTHYPGRTGALIRDAQKAVTGILPQGDVVKLGSALARAPKLYSVDRFYAGTLVGDKPVAEMRVGHAMGYVLKEKLDALSEPDAGALDAVYVLPTPKPIKAGDLIGHLGNYHNRSDLTHLGTKRLMTHIEVFSGGDVPAFIARSKARSAKLDAKTKTRLRIEKGALLCEAPKGDLLVYAHSRLLETSDSPKTGLWAKVNQVDVAIKAKSELSHYQTSDKSYLLAGKKVYFTGRFFGPTDADVTTDEKLARKENYTRREVLIPKPRGPFWVERKNLSNNPQCEGWTHFPLDITKLGPLVYPGNRVMAKAELDKYPVAVDEHNRHWWKVTSTSHWVCEKDHPKVTWVSPWDWSEFVVISESSTPADHFVSTVHNNNGAKPTEAHNFQQRADGVENSPLFKSLLETIRGVDGNQNNREGMKLSTNEIKAALNTKLIGDRIGRIIVNYESEWGGSMAKWDEFDSIMLGGLPSWQAEKTRIAKLAFWDKVQTIEGFPTSPEVYHFHPVGLVGDFYSPITSCEEMFRKISPIVLNNEGGYVDDPNDSGGKTNMGIAWATWQAYAMIDLGVEPTKENLKKLTKDQAEIIYRKRYWEPRGFCGFKNLKTALNVYDWTITSYKAPKKIQEILVNDYGKDIAINNIMSKSVIDAINEIPDQEAFVQKIGVSRKEYYISLTTTHGIPNKNMKFHDGWLARVDRCIAFKE